MRNAIRKEYRPRLSIVRECAPGTLTTEQRMDLDAVQRPTWRDYGIRVVITLVVLGAPVGLCRLLLLAIGR